MLILTKTGEEDAKGKFYSALYSGNIKEITACIIEDPSCVNKIIFGTPPLQLAINFGNLIVVGLLLDCKADINCRNSKTGDTVLDIAKKSLAVDMIDLLSAYGANSRYPNKVNFVYPAYDPTDSEIFIRTILEDGHCHNHYTSQNIDDSNLSLIGADSMELFE